MTAVGHGDGGDGPDSRPLIGMIVPPAGDEVPPEAAAMFPHELRFIARGLGLGRLAPEGYDGVVGKVAVLARELAGAGAAVIAVMGTSLGFYRGRAFNEALTAEVAAATGLPTVTMAMAVVEALEGVGARRVALATAYAAEVNRRLETFLREHGLEPVGLAALDIVDVAAVAGVTDADLLALGGRAVAAAKAPDALFISCGGLRTLRVTPALAARHGLPVVSSATAGVWAAARRAGIERPIGELAGGTGPVGRTLSDRAGGGRAGLRGRARSLRHSFPRIWPSIP